MKNCFRLRKITVAILCSLLAGLVAVSCKNNETPSENHNLIPTTPALVGKGILYGAGSESIPQQNIIITTFSAWNTLINSMNSANNVSGSFTETNIDFSQYQVIAIFDEIKGNGGWSIDITGITEAENIVVTYTNLKTGNFTDVMTQPYHIVKIPVSNKEIVFQHK
jgi:hypothetical protein